MEDFRIKIAVLWLFMAVATSSIFVTIIMMPFHNQQIIAGKFEGVPITEVMLLMVAFYWLIPLTLAFLSLTLKGSAIRWANIIAAIFFAGWSIISTGGHLSQGWLALSLIEFSKIVVAALIIWRAWKWPKE